MSEPEALIEVMGAMDAVLAGHAWALRVRRVDGAEETVALAGATLSIGRAEANDIHLDDSQLSRFHARVALDDGAWVLTDLSSKNGTTVNGKATDRRVLEHGDLVQVGESVLVFERSEAMAAAPAEPIAAPVSGTPDDRMDALLAFGEMLACAEEELGVLDEVVGRLRDIVQSDRCILYLVEEGQSKPLMQYASEDTVTGEGDEAATPLMERAMAADEPEIDSLPGPVPRYIMVVPLHSRYRKMGVFVLERSMSAGSFQEGELRVASIASSHVTTFLRGVI